MQANIENITNEKPFNYFSDARYVTQIFKKLSNAFELFAVF